MAHCQCAYRQCYDSRCSGLLERHGHGRGRTLIEIDIYCLSMSIIIAIRGVFTRRAVVTWCMRERTRRPVFFLGQESKGDFLCIFKPALIWDGCHQCKRTNLGQKCESRTGPNTASIPEDQSIFHPLYINSADKRQDTGELTPVALTPIAALPCFER